MRGLDLKVPAGSIFALIGPNGAGKTTTIKMLMNLVRPTTGRATVLGVPPAAAHGGRVAADRIRLRKPGAA